MLKLLVRGELFELPDDQATILAEELRGAAAGEFGEPHQHTGGRPLADAIELRLVGERDDPVAVDEAQAIALFDYLNITGKPGDPLYLAVRAIHDELGDH
jgi:hypothetical protein